MFHTNTYLLYNVIVYILPYQKDVLREDFGSLQKWRKEVILKIGNVMWGKHYTNHGDGENDEETFMVNVALMVTLGYMCIYCRW